MRIAPSRVAPERAKRATNPTPQPRTRKCKDCNTTFEVRSNPPVSPRCTPCRIKRVNAQARKRAERPASPTYICADCGEEKPRFSLRGAKPKRCAPCQRTRSKAKPRTPMPKATKPIKHRNTKRRSAVAAVSQRELVMARDETCAFERLVGTNDWRRCGSSDRLATCHVVRRHQCGDAWASPDVAIAGCTPCHDAADHRTAPVTWENVRFPEIAIQRAVAAIKAAEQARIDSGKGVVALKNRSAA